MVGNGVLDDTGCLLEEKGDVISFKHMVHSQEDEGVGRVTTPYHLGSRTREQRVGRRGWGLKGRGRENVRVMSAMWAGLGWPRFNKIRRQLCIALVFWMKSKLDQDLLPDYSRWIIGAMVGTSRGVEGKGDWICPSKNSEKLTHG